MCFGAQSLYISILKGAATQVWCGTSPELNGLGGVYCEDVNIASLLDMQNKQGLPSLKEHLHGVMPYAVDPDEAEQLWEISKKMIDDKK